MGKVDSCQGQAGQEQVASVRAQTDRHDCLWVTRGQEQVTTEASGRDINIVFLYLIYFDFEEKMICIDLYYKI